MKRFIPFIGCLLLTACSGESLQAPLVDSPSESGELRLDGEIRVGFVPLQPQLTPLSCRILWQEQVLFLDPLSTQLECIPAALREQSILEVQFDPPDLERIAMEESRDFYPLRLHFFGSPPSPLAIPLVPIVAMDEGSYLEAIDLLQEHIKPFSGSALRRWPFRRLSVALPEGKWPVDYRSCCLEALQEWNNAMGEDLLIPGEDPLWAHIVCEVSEQTSLGYTRILAEDEWGHPLRMQIHLSPRWIDGAEKYVYRAWLHEFGHALGLWGHSRDLIYLMNGRSIITDRIHPHELMAMRWLWQLPTDFDLSWIQRDTHPDILARPRNCDSRITLCSDAMANGTGEIRPVSAADLLPAATPFSP